MQGGYRKWIVGVTPWVFSFVLVCLLSAMLLLNGNDIDEGEGEVTVRKIEVGLPPPPEPPRPLQAKMEDYTSPAVDVLGSGSGPKLAFSVDPKFSILNIEKVDQPNIDLSKVDLARALSINFPLVEVKELDQIPKLVSSNSISFPKELRTRGIKRVSTTVEIIIDQNGKAFVKKIVDPVFPEMISVIRKAINNSRFSVPLKNGKPVQAIYLYNLVFINRI